MRTPPLRETNAEGDEKEEEEEEKFKKIFHD